MAYIWRSLSMVKWMILASFLIPCLALPERGIFNLKINQAKNILIQQKSLYANASISIHITDCKSTPSEAKLRFSWSLLERSCLNDMQGVQSQMDVKRLMGNVPLNPRIHASEVHKCKDDISLTNHALSKAPTIAPPATHATVDGKNDSTTPTTNNGSRSARAVNNERTNTNDSNPAEPTKVTSTDDNKSASFQVAKTINESVYIVVIEITPFVSAISKPVPNSNVTFNVGVKLSTKNPTGYLSSAEYPLLPFWIGGVIAFGMVEKAVFYSVYNFTNGSGQANQSLLVFAELISCMKRTIARMLVIIVSLGYGIVKPRLGPMLNRVLGVGGLYFVLSMIESMMRVVQTKGEATQKILFASLPLALVDAGICWWISFLFCLSVIFMVWSIKTHQVGNCIKVI
ncbi:Transmembrane protein 87A [Trichoplax sp. H2]|nr:Transmembrane protein 87A [Trichoplax sp. H2]|eukprot:RDD39822.1 Transmembrane protein 87A [Trichoplax sp. H2]